MRTDVQKIEEFYASPIGQLAQDFISQRLLQAWQRAKGLRVAGFGFAGPYLDLFDEAERLIDLAPEGMGAISSKGRGITCLTGDHHWPLADASMDRVLIIHGLEEAAAPRKLLREIWRVLTDDGRVIIAVPNRRGPWSMVETTPFSAGRPYLKGQLDRLLSESMFSPSYWSSALYFPPSDYRFLLRAANAWERAGELLWSPFAGLTLVEAVKELAVPAGGSKVEVTQPELLRPIPSQMVQDRAA
ncbi:MAG: class I SAM-dependent methyltransferase [bacterium]